MKGFGFIGSALLTLALLADATEVHGAEPREWTFGVFLDDKPIGHQAFRLTRDGGEQRIAIRADFAVRFFSFTVYRYRHRNEEVWHDGCLARIESHTDDNGRISRVRGERGASGFAVETLAGRQSLGACVWTFAYWDESFLDRAELLNPQTGAHEPVRATLVGTEPMLANGSPIEARRYLLEGESFRIDLWYSLEGEWLGLQSRTGNGGLLRFVRILGDREGASGKRI
jgi:hypothetical protein